MIVISGALVVVALVLLVLGVTGPELDLVYGSIAVSLLSLVFLVLGIIQRRGEVLPAVAGGGAPVASEPSAQAMAASPATIAAPLVRSDAEEHQAAGEQQTDGQELDEPEVDDPAGGVSEPLGLTRSGSAPLAVLDEDTSGTVLVVAGRPRYHVAGCRYLAGKTPESRDVSDAVAQGFSPCGVCRPDDVLRGASSPSDGLFPEPVPRARAPRVAAARPPRAPRTPAEHVVVVPDRNRYHRAECRHVRGLAGSESLQPAEAVGQGYSACGVCKP